MKLAQRTHAAWGAVLVSVAALPGPFAVSTRGAPAAAGVTLVRDGRPEATLVLAAKPRQVAQLAAAEFQHYLEKITGCRLPQATDEAETAGVRVLIGESKATQALGFTSAGFESEQWCVKTGAGFLLIVGREHDSYGEITYEKDGVYPDFAWHQDMGTFFGVLDFLERECDVRWYLPGELGEVVPTRQTLAVGPVDRRRRPWARHRWVAPRPFPKRLYHYATLTLTEGPPTIEQVADWRDVNLWWLRQKLRNEPFSSSHSYGEFYKRFHKTHPEYFAQGWPLDKPHYIQPAFHKPEVIQAVTEMAIAHFDQPAEQRNGAMLHCRSAEYFSVSPMDNNRWCKSPEAQAKFEGPSPAEFWGGWASRYIWDFVNEVARRVGAKHPDRWIACHAYWQERLPYEGMTIEPNVAVTFCRALTREWHPDIHLRNERDLAAWLKLGPKRLYLYDYVLFPQHRRHNVFPGWAPHRIAADLRRMKRIGLRGAYNDIACVSVGGRQWKDRKWVPYVWANPVLDQVNFYVWLKFLDDQSRTVDEILDEMYERFYGPAGPHIKQFIELGERIYFSWPRYKRALSDLKHLDGETSWTALCPPETLAEFGRIMAAARAAAATPLQKRRVQTFDEGVFRMMTTSSAHWRKENRPLTAANSQPLPIKWRVMPDPEKKGRDAKWFAVDLDDAGWREASTLMHLEKQGIEEYEHAWYRVRAEVPSERQGRKVLLRLGAVDETCWIWVNGEAAGEYIYDAVRDTSSWRRPMFFDVTEFIRFGAPNQITVLVQNVSGMGGIWRPSHLVFETPGEEQ